MQEQTALVTGAASGLGRCLAELLAGEGFTVAVCDVNDEAGSRLAADIGGHYFHLDVSSLEQWQAQAAAIESSLGAPGKVFLNAGIMVRPPTEPIDDDPLLWMDRGYAKLMSVNVDGALFGLHTLAAPMAAAGGGDIVVTASIAGLSPLPFDPYYAMSKHAVIGMVRSFAPVLEPRGIRINAFCPGGMVTEIVPLALRASAGSRMMTGEDAAASCLEISNRPGTGGLWVREEPARDLWEYRMPALYE